MKIKLDNGAFMPERAYKNDAGYDLRAIEEGMIPAHSFKLFNTGVHIQLPKDTCGMMISKSGLNCYEGTQSTGLIDEGYTGAIKVALYNHTDSDKWIRRGDKISQIVIVPILKPILSIVDEFDVESDRGNKGFGSSGR